MKQQLSLSLSQDIQLPPASAWMWPLCRLTTWDHGHIQQAPKVSPVPTALSGNVGSAGCLQGLGWLSAYRVHGQGPPSLRHPKSLPDPFHNSATGPRATARGSWSICTAWQAMGHPGTPKQPSRMFHSPLTSAPAQPGWSFSLSYKTFPTTSLQRKRDFETSQLQNNI